MLVLSRHVGDEIIIGGTIRLMVLAADGSRVRLGIVAPTDVVVDRQEIHDRRKDTVRALGSKNVKE